MLSSGSALGSQFATQSSSYSNAGLEVEYANDPASGGFFQTDYKKCVGRSENLTFSSHCITFLSVATKT